MREPQWFGAQFSRRTNGEAMKGGRIENAEAYLCGSVLVQNFLLEPRHVRREYAASAVPPGGPEKGPCRRGQAGRLRFVMNEILPKTVTKRFARGQRPEIRGQKTEIRGQGVGSQRAVDRGLTIDDLGI